MTFLAQNESDFFDAVKEFHEAFDHPVNVGLGDDETNRLRVALVLEELQELEEALGQTDLVGMADALADISYVVFGAAVAFGLDGDYIAQYSGYPGPEILATLFTRGVQMQSDVIAQKGLGAVFAYVKAFADEIGLNLVELFNEVHKSNMTKLGVDGKPIHSDGVTPDATGKIRPKGKVIKGPNYTEPDIEGLLKSEVAWSR